MTPRVQASGGAALVAPPGAVPALADAAVAAARVVAQARADLLGSAATVRASGWATDAAAAVRAGHAVRALEESLASTQAELTHLARLLGAAQAELDRVEAVVAGAARRHDQGSSTLDGALHALAVVGGATLTEGAQGLVRATPPGWTALLTTIGGYAVDDGPGDATLADTALPGGDTAPLTLAGWFARVDVVSSTPGRIALTDVGDGAWVVQLPGIHSLLPTADPQDLVGAVAALGTGHSAYAGAVVVALRRAGVPAGARLLLVGHSQGGIVATGLAADPAVRARWQVTHVVTAGSPVSTARVPRGTQLLEVDNDDDLVTALDGRAGRDGAGRTVLRFRHEHGDLGRDHGLAATYVPFLASPAAAADPRARAFADSAHDYLRGGPSRTQVFDLRDRPTVPRAPGPPLPGVLLGPGGGPALPRPRPTVD